MVFSEKLEFTLFIKKLLFISPCLFLFCIFYIEDNSSIAIPLNMDVKKQSEMSLCQSKVCGDRVKCYDCGNEVADWLNDCLLRSDLRLVRQSSVDSR